MHSRNSSATMSELFLGKMLKLYGRSKLHLSCVLLACIHLSFYNENITLYCATLNASCANKVKGFVQKRANQNHLLNNIAVEEMMKQMSQAYFPHRIRKQSASFPFLAFEHFLQNLHHSSLKLHCRQFSYVLGNAFKKQPCQTSC